MKKVALLIIIALLFTTGEAFSQRHHRAHKRHKEQTVSFPVNPFPYPFIVGEERTYTVKNSIFDLTPGKIIIYDDGSAKLYEDIYDMTPSFTIPDGNAGWIIYEDIYDISPGYIIPDQPLEIFDPIF